MTICLCDFSRQLAMSVLQRSWALFAAAEKGQTGQILSHVTPMSHLAFCRCDGCKPRKHWVCHTLQPIFGIFSHVCAHVRTRVCIPIKSIFSTTKKRLDKVERWTKPMFIRVLSVTPFVTPFLFLRG